MENVTTENLMTEKERKTNELIFQKIRSEKKKKKIKKCGVKPKERNKKIKRQINEKAMKNEGNVRSDVKRKSGRKKE